jgi:hypothetical protein
MKSVVQGLSTIKHWQAVLHFTYLFASGITHLLWVMMSVSGLQVIRPDDRMKE